MTWCLCCEPICCYQRGAAARYCILFPRLVIPHRHMGQGNGIKQAKSSFRKLALPLVLLILVYIYWMHNDVRQAVPKRDSAQYGDFIRTWCRQRRARVDWEAVLRPCAGKMAWSPDLKVSDWTDASKVYLTLWDIRPAGEFSRFGLQTRKSNIEEKRVGGDSWRVHIRGPASVSPTIIDHDNGTYEIIFLILEPGKYKVEVILEYSMCDGFRDPPRHWFIRGESHFVVLLSAWFSTRMPMEIHKTAANIQVITSAITLQNSTLCALCFVNRPQENPCQQVLHWLMYYSIPFDIACYVNYHMYFFSV